MLIKLLGTNQARRHPETSRYYCAGVTSRTTRSPFLWTNSRSVDYQQLTLLMSIVLGFYTMPSDSWHSSATEPQWRMR